MSHVTHINESRGERNDESCQINKSRAMYDRETKEGVKKAEKTITDHEKEARKTSEQVFLEFFFGI